MQFTASSAGCTLRSLSGAVSSAALLTRAQKGSAAEYRPCSSRAASSSAVGWAASRRATCMCKHPNVVNHTETSEAMHCCSSLRAVHCSLDVCEPRRENRCLLYRKQSKQMCWLLLSGTMSHMLHG